MRRKQNNILYSFAACFIRRIDCVVVVVDETYERAVRAFPKREKEKPKSARNWLEIAISKTNRNNLSMHFIESNLMLGSDLLPLTISKRVCVICVQMKANSTMTQSILKCCLFYFFLLISVLFLLFTRCSN